MQDEFEPPTLESLDNDLSEQAGYMEGQQILLDFLFETLAGNLSPSDKERLLESLRDLLNYPDEAAQLPILRVIKQIGTPKPRLQLIRGGIGDEAPATD